MIIYAFANNRLVDKWEDTSINFGEHIVALPDHTIIYHSTNSRMSERNWYRTNATMLESCKYENIPKQYKLLLLLHKVDK